MTRPPILDLDLVVVPSKADVGMLGEWYRYKNGHRFSGEEPARDTSDVGAYSAMLSASPYLTAWDDLRKYIAELEKERDTLAKMDEAATSTFVHWRSRAQTAEAEVAEKDKVIAALADAAIERIDATERRQVDDESEILQRLADGDTIVFSLDGDMAWFTNGDRAFVGDAIMRLREKGYLLRKRDAVDDDDDPRGIAEYDTISEAGRAARAYMDVK